MLKALRRWRLNRRLSNLREKLAGKEAALAELRRCGHGNYGIAEDAGVLKYRIEGIERAMAALAASPSAHQEKGAK